MPGLAALLALGTSKVVEHLPHHPKVKGLSPATHVYTGIEKMAKKFQSLV